MQSIKVSLPIVLSLIFIGFSNPTAIYASDDDSSNHESNHQNMMHDGMVMTDDSHVHHHHRTTKDTKVYFASYELPKIKLIRDDGMSVSFKDELDDGRPVIMNFIYTACTEVCPLTTRTFSLFQDGLGTDRDKVLIISISIDPEQDTPQVLKKYASKYGAESEWNFYTGTLEASISAQKAFEVYHGDKMEHTAVTFLRSAPGKPWLRIDEFPTSKDLLHEYRNLIASR